jgi:N-glycosylase/DNA lyase
MSHGLVSLPPMEIDEEARVFRVTASLPSTRPRTLELSPGSRGTVLVTGSGRAPSARAAGAIEDAVRHILHLDLDLSGFYDAAASDPELAWVTAGAGRMIRSQSVFEDVVKTICTTNCAWSGTVRMVGAIVEHLGEPAADAPATGPLGRAFPTAGAMADVPEDFYRDVVRAGYRSKYLRDLARSVADGDVDLEALAAADRSQVSDAELAATLQTLPGVGPYAAAHIMMLIGRHSLLILDSWTRPTYARIAGRKTVSDATIERRFKRYREYAGLAFWMLLTKSWVSDHA